MSGSSWEGLPTVHPVLGEGVVEMTSWLYTIIKYTVGTGHIAFKHICSNIRIISGGNKLWDHSSCFELKLTYPWVWLNKGSTKIWIYMYVHASIGRSGVEVIKSIVEFWVFFPHTIFYGHTDVSRYTVTLTASKTPLWSGRQKRTVLVPSRHSHLSPSRM